MTRTWLLLIGSLAAVTFATIVLVIVPQVMLVQTPPSTPLRPYSAAEARGRAVYIANGCVYCHSQQVRDPAFTTDVDRGWGSRATVPADYVYDSPHLLGTMRTGPDLINVGQRLPDPNWHLIHLYNPRALVPWSIMPAFPFLFELRDSSAVRPGETIVQVPRRYAAPHGKVVVATRDALELVAYLRSLNRQYPVPPPARAAGPAVGAGTDARPGHSMP
jgi:cytochrome c oxidase cbb3-type subunit II